MTAAARMAALRARRAAGRIVLRVEVDEIELAEKMVATGFLDRDKSDDRDALTSAIERLLENLQAV